MGLNRRNKFACVAVFLSDESLLTLLTGDVIKGYYNTLNNSRLTVV